MYNRNILVYKFLIRKTVCHWSQEYTYSNPICIYGIYMSPMNLQTILLQLRAGFSLI